MASMCGRYSTTMDPETLFGVFGVDPGGSVELENGGADALYGGDTPRPRYNIGPTTDNPVVRVRAAGDGVVRRRIELMRWGLVPSWAKDPSVGNRMFNARAESVSDKPAFRKALATRRCLVPASGFFEWQKLAGPRSTARQKQPYYITPLDGSVLAFAGLWEYWRPRAAGRDRTPTADPTGPDDAIVSYTILTTAAVGAMAEIHDRMPLILPAADWDSWLDETAGAEQVVPLLAPPSPDLVAGLEFRAVSSRVGAVAHDDADILRPVEPLTDRSHPGADADSQPARPPDQPALPLG